MSSVNISTPVQQVAILKAISFCARELFTSTDWDAGINAALRTLGEAARVSRVYIFVSHRSMGQPYIVDQTHEWVAPGIRPQINNPNLTGFNFHPSYIRWINAFEGKDIIAGIVREFPQSEQKELVEEGIKSIVLAPMFIHGEWCGLVGFDECTTERVWEQDVIEALRAAVSVFGGAFERRLAEQALRESEKKYANFIEHAPFGILQFDKDGVILYENPAFMEIIGAPHGQVTSSIGKKITELPNVIEAGVVGYLQEIIKGKVVKNITVPFTSSYQKKSCLLVSGIPLFDSKNAVIGAFLAMVDISDQKVA